MGNLYIEKERCSHKKEKEKEKERCYTNHYSKKEKKIKYKTSVGV